MSDPFFAKKRKRSASKVDRRVVSKGPQRAKKAPRVDNDEISSDSDAGRGPVHSDDDEEALSESEILNETPAEKRLRIAKTYLDKVTTEIAEGEGFDAAEIDRDLIAARLEKDNLAQGEKLYLRIAEQVDVASITVKSVYAREKSCITTVVRHGSHCYATYKSGTLHKWKCAKDSTGSMTLAKTVRRAHEKSILCSAINHDGTRLATGSADKTITLWDTVTMQKLKTFTNHRDSVNALSFPMRGGDEFFSASSDRSVKLFNVTSQSYIESLFGHQDHIASLSSLTSANCVTVGSRDRTARLWKIVDESQLVFRAGDRREEFHEGSIDTCSQIDKELFVTGSDNGTLALWSTQKKKSLARLPCTHGRERGVQGSAEAQEREENVTPEKARWVTAIYAIPYSDLVLSGSWNGNVNVYQVSADNRKLAQVGAVKVGKGVVNSITAQGSEKDGWQVTVALGYETRLARWKTVGGAMNGIVSFTIPPVKAAAVSN